MSSEFVITTGAATFAAKVIEASHQRPVLVDFWAEWCAPCRAIAPALEALAVEFNGRLIVAKVDTDAEQDLARTYGIRSLPTMLLFRYGKPVEQIIGAQPGSAIRAVVERFLPRPGDDLIDQGAALLASGESAAAGERLREALSVDPVNYRIHPLLAQALIQQRDYGAAEDLVASLPINIAADAAFEPINAKLRLAGQVTAGADGNVREDRAADRDNVEARFQRRLRQALENDLEAALDGLLELVARFRDWNDGAIRKAIIDIFTLMGNDNPRIKEYRTRLARTLT